MKNEISNITAYKLELDNMLVGVLYHDGFNWTFEYSDKFKKQRKYNPIVNFPDVEKKYTSKVLWPFFTSRVPGKGQLKLRKEENCDINVLLQKYGQKSATNPFLMFVIASISIIGIINLLKN